MSKAQDGSGGGSECVQVAVRCRPLSSKEVNDKRVQIVEMDTKSSQVRVRPPSSSPSSSSAASSEEAKAYTFDLVFDSRTSQAQLYDSTCRLIVDSVMQGYNGTIFAYGQTGTGKTFTMEGATEESLKGIIPRAFDQVFAQIDISADVKYLVRASFIQIYNDDILDLLSSTPDKKLMLREARDTGVYIQDVVVQAVDGVPALKSLLEKGKASRKVAGTNMNDFSSRSHCIFAITVESCVAGPDGKDLFKAGKLNMVDLAGSERQGKTGAEGSVLKEGIKINQSLSALGNVIAALVSKKKDVHVPYRDSKLTRLLQDSLGGNTKTVMIANIGPADYNYEETISTLRFADRAKQIKNKPRINEDPKDAKLRELQETIAKLKAELAASENDLSSTLPLPSSSSSSSSSSLLSATLPPPRLATLTKIIEKEVIVGVDKKQLEQLHHSQAEMKKKIEEHHRREKEAVENLKAELEQKSSSLLSDIKSKEQELKHKQQARLALKHSLQDMENKLVMGKKIIDQSQKHALMLEKKKAEALRLEVEKQRLEREKEAKAELALDLQAKYDSIERALSDKHKKFQKLKDKYQECKHSIEETQASHQTERESLLDTIRELTRHIQLKEQILQHFVPKNTVDKMEGRIYWDEEKGEWATRPLNLAAFRNGDRPGSVWPHAVRPTTEFARAKLAMGDPSPRYRVDNILELQLEMPNRTTQDFDEFQYRLRQQQAEGLI